MKNVYFLLNLSRIAIVLEISCTTGILYLDNIKKFYQLIYLYCSFVLKVLLLENVQKFKKFQRIKFILKFLTR